MATQWFYKKNDEKVGPVSSQELKQLAEQGRIDASTLVWKEGIAEWVEARRVKGLISDAGESAIGLSGILNNYLPPPAAPTPPSLPSKKDISQKQSANAASESTTTVSQVAHQTTPASNSTATPASSGVPKTDDDRTPIWIWLLVAAAVIFLAGFAWWGVRQQMNAATAENELGAPDAEATAPSKEDPSVVEPEAHGEIPETSRVQNNASKGSTGSETDSKLPAGDEVAQQGKQVSKIPAEATRQPLAENNKQEPREAEAGPLQVFDYEKEGWKLEPHVGINLTEAYNAKFEEFERSRRSRIDFTKQQTIVTRLPDVAGDIKITPKDSIYAIENYLESYYSAVGVKGVMGLRNRTDFLYILGKLEDGDSSYALGKVAELARALAKLKNINVPPSAVKFHKALLGYIQLVMTSFVKMSNYPNDMIKGMVGIHQLDLLEKKYASLLAAEVRRLKKLAQTE